MTFEWRTNWETHALPDESYRVQVLEVLEKEMTRLRIEIRDKEQQLEAVKWIRLKVWHCWDIVQPAIKKLDTEEGRKDG